MAYNYQVERTVLFTEQGQITFLRVRDNVHKLLEVAGAVRMQEAYRGVGGGDSWMLLACVDRLVELGEIVEISKPGCVGQHRVFVKA